MMICHVKTVSWFPVRSGFAVKDHVEKVDRIHQAFTNL